MIATAWPTDTFLLALGALVVVLSAVAYLCSKFAQMVLREAPEPPAPRDLEGEARQLRDVAARDYHEQAQRLRTVKR